MSSTDHPESGVPDSSHPLESGLTTTTPQQSTHPEIDTTDSTASLAKSDTVAKAPSPTSPAVLHQPLSEENAATAPQHPATGGEPVAPMTTTTNTTTTGAAQPVALNQSATAIPADTTATSPIAPSPSAESPSMETHEPKAAAEPSDQSEELGGKEVEQAGPALVITLLLTTGSRHPFTIDAKYLRKQSVNVENDDPFTMSVYTLKELIWREWRSGEFRGANETVIPCFSILILLLFCQTGKLVLHRRVPSV